MTQQTPGEHLLHILEARGIVRNTKTLSAEEKAEYELAAALFTQSAAACANVHSENQGLPCTFCGHKLKRLQIDVDRERGLLNVRINWAWTKAEALKQAKGLAQMIKQFAEGL